MFKYLSFRNLQLFFTTIYRVRNWATYFQEFFGLATKDHLTYRTRDGLQYYVRTNTTDRSIVNSVAIQDEYQLRQLNLRQAVIIDLGGQNGYFSVFAARYARRILTYEPIPENYDNILKNIKLNHLEDIVWPCNLAVSHQEGTLKIHLSHNTGGHSIYGGNEAFEEVQATTLPAIFEEHAIMRCDLLKLDIEGSEYNILYHLPDACFAKISNIRMEVHEIDQDQKNHRYLIDFLKGKGYNILQFEKAILFAQRPKR